MLKGEGEIAVIVKEKVIRNVAQPGIEERGEHNRGAYCWQASSVANFDWNSRKVFGSGGRASTLPLVVC